MGKNQLDGWHNMHLVEGNWIMEKTVRVEGKQDNWLGNGQGKLELAGWHHLEQEPFLEESGEDELEGKWYETSCVPGSRVGLWIVESLATSGLYCMIF